MNTYRSIGGIWLRRASFGCRQNAFSTVVDFRDGGKAGAADMLGKHYAANRSEKKNRKLAYARPEEYNSRTSHSPKQTRFPVGLRRNERVANQKDGEMDITFLGTASCTPSMTRGVSCTALHFKGDMHLFDCGESSQLQFTFSSISTTKVSKIFISHMHGDHLFGLPAVLCGLGQAMRSRLESRDMSQEEVQSHVVDIYGPEGIREFVRTTLSLSESKLTVPHRIHELKGIPQLNFDKVVPRKGPEVESSRRGARRQSVYGEMEGGTDISPDSQGNYLLCETVHERDGSALTVRAAPLSHSIPCVGFVVEERARAGALNAKLVEPIVEANRESLNRILDGDYRKINKTLKALGPDDSYTFPNGTELFGRDILAADIPGRKVVILGDTYNSDRIKPLAMGADLLVHEATVVPDFEGTLSDAQLRREAIAKGHSSPAMAGEFAAAIQAKQLILTHFTSSCSGNHDLPAMQYMWSVEDVARRAAKDLSKPNDVIAAWDFMNIGIRSKKPAAK